MEIVQELIFIIGGLALTHIFIGLYKLIVSFGKSKPINISHSLIAVLSPLVVWQYIYGFASFIGSFEDRGVAINIQFEFLTSIIVLITLSTLVGMSFILFPEHKSLSYTTSDPNFISHLKENRRIFYLLVIFYLISISIGNILIGQAITVMILVSRLIMVFISLIGLFINFETEKNFLIINLRLLWFAKEENPLGFDIKKIKKLVMLKQVELSNPQRALEKRAKYYDKIDLIAALIFLTFFLVIVIVRLNE